MNDLELARRLAHRDSEAINRLVADHHSAVYRFLRQLTRHVEDAEDLAQQTLIRTLNAASRYDGRTSLRAWILGIAFHEFSRWRRRRLWLPLTVDRPMPGDDYKRLIEAEALLDALGRLPEGMRAAFLLHYVEGLSVTEVAISLSIPEGTVKSRLHKARARLSGLLNEEIQYVPTPIQP